MADQSFVNPDTEAALTTIAMGVVPAGTASTEQEIEWRYKWGQPAGAGHLQTAFVLRSSVNGGVTWTTDSIRFVLRIIEALNPGNDPLFLGTATAGVPTSRLDVAPARANTGYVVGLTCQPDLRPGANQESIQWELGVLYNETFRTIGLIPDAPSGILTGLDAETVNEWITAPTLTNDTDKVTLGDCSYVFSGIEIAIGGADVTLDQNDGASAALGSGEEYVAVLSVGSAGTVSTTKGSKATSGSAAQPVYPAGELPLAVVRVPYGGVIAASTLLAFSGRCLVEDGGGLTVTVGSGRAQMPGLLLTPIRTVLTVPNDTTSRVYVSQTGTINLSGGLALADVTTSGGVVTVVTDLRVMLYRGLRPGIYGDTDAHGAAISNVILGPVVSLADNVNAGGYGIENLNRSGVKGNAASVEVVFGRSVKRPCRAAATSNVASLSGEQTIDGVALTDGQRVLLSAQSTAAEIGCWYVRTGAWERPLDNDDSYQIYAGCQVVVCEGSNRGIWVQTGTWGAEAWAKVVALP